MATALLSSYKKDESLLRLARLLEKNRWNLLGSAGTTQFLTENGIACKDVSEIVGAPILGHRVVTLSREIYAGLLATTDEDYKELERLHIIPIDLVYVVLYPLEETIGSSGTSPEDIIEKTDIGGPTLLRAAAKGRRIVLSAPEQIDALEKWIRDGSSESEKERIITLFAGAAERRVADYVSASASYWERQA